MVVASTPHIVIKEVSNVNFTPLELLFNGLCLLITLRSFLSQQLNDILFRVRGISTSCANHSHQLTVLLREGLMLGNFLVVLVPYCLQLFLLLTVLIYLSFEFIRKPLHGGLELLNFRLFEVEILAVLSLALQLTNFITIHTLNALTQIRKLWLFQGNLLAAIALFLLELNLILGLASLTHLLLLRSTLSEPTAHRSILQRHLPDMCRHRLLFRHWWLGLEFIMYCLNDCSERGLHWVPSSNSWPFVLDGDGVKRGM